MATRSTVSSNVNQRQVIGVDFGSSQSSIAVLSIGDTGIPELMNFGGGLGGYSEPTLLALDENDGSLIACGQLVKKKFRDANEGIVFASNFKRYLGNGRDADIYCRKYIAFLGEWIRKKFSVNELSSNDYVTCFAYPATWSNEKVEKLRQYAVEAGFPEDEENGIYVFPEPVAAMHALKVQDSLKFCYGNRPENYMVIDFGGGTLDICVIRTGILGRTPKIIAQAGDSELGGKDFDDIVETQFYRKCNISKDELSPTELAELDEEFRKAKENFALNFAKNDEVTYQFSIMRDNFNLTMQRLEFENICEDRGIFGKIEHSIDDALQQAGLSKAKISKVILTGGSSKWYFMRERVAKKFSLGGNSIYLTQNPFTDVAVGCAVAIGRPEAPLETKGVWAQWRVSGNSKWTMAPCWSIEPGVKGGDGTQNRLYVGTMIGTPFWPTWTPWGEKRSMEFQFLTGYSEDDIVAEQKVAKVEFELIGNHPYMGRFFNMIDALKGERPPALVDKYRLYLISANLGNGQLQHIFEVLDYAASEKDRMTLANEDQSIVELMPNGTTQQFVLTPGVTVTHPVHTF